jgi:hypothetical protein
MKNMMSIFRALKWLIKWWNTKQSKQFSARIITVDCDSLSVFTLFVYTQYYTLPRYITKKNRYSLNPMPTPKMQAYEI